MTGASVDASEVRRLSADLRDAPLRVVLAARPVVFRGATQIKDQLIREMRESAHFKGVASAIDFDLDAAGLSAEIGPRAEPGSAGNLANVAYFGGSRGGGTVPDPQGALDAEAPKFEKALGDLLGGML